MRRMRTIRIGYLEYSEIRLLSRDAYRAVFKKGDVFEILKKDGTIVRVEV